MTISLRSPPPSSGIRCSRAPANTGRAAIRIFGRSPADTARSQRACAPSTRPVSPVSTSTSRSGPASTAQYGPGWTAYWASVSRYQRAAASSSGSGGRRPAPEQPAHQTCPRGALVGGHGGAGVGRGTAEDRHEAGQAVVPVGGAGDAVDRGGVVGVGPQQPLLVGPEPAGGHADVAAGDGEVGVAGDRHEARARRPAGPRDPRRDLRSPPPRRARARRSGRRPGPQEAPVRRRPGPTRPCAAATAGGPRRWGLRAGAPARRSGRRTGAGGGGRSTSGRSGGRPHPAAAGATRDDGRSGRGGSADAVACSSRGEGQFRMAGIVAGRPALVQGECASIT